MKIRFMIILMVLVPGIGLTSKPSRAEEVKAGQFLEMYDQQLGPEARKEAEIIISYIEDGFGWANAELTSRKTPPLYCLPPKLALTGPQLIDILRRAIAEQAPLPNPLSDQLLGLALLVSLERVFPCPPGSN
jgi:hypothetical protein